MRFHTGFIGAPCHKSALVPARSDSLICSISTNPSDNNWTGAAPVRSKRRSESLFLQLSAGFTACQLPGSWAGRAGKAGEVDGAPALPLQEPGTCPLPGLRPGCSGAAGQHQALALAAGNKVSREGRMAIPRKGQVPIPHHPPLWHPAAAGLGAAAAAGHSLCGAAQLAAVA